MGAPRQDEAMARVAASIGVTVVRPLAGGQFGACVVRAPGDDCDLVLKAVDWPAAADGWARGASMATLVRDAVADYPASRYIGTGTVDGLTWSLQEHLPGAIPDPIGDAHVRRLVALAESHAGLVSGRAGGSDTATDIASRIRGELPTLEAEPLTAWLADDLAQLLGRLDGLELRSNDVWHFDFHRFNCLAMGDRITGVFDWEGARPGDYRLDLANLAVTTSGDAALLVDEALRAASSAEVAAICVAWHTARYLAFDTHHHRDQLAERSASIERERAPWWRVLF